MNKQNRSVSNQPTLTTTKAQLFVILSQEELARLTPAELRFLASAYHEDIEGVSGDDLEGLDIGTPEEYRQRIFERVMDMLSDRHHQPRTGLRPAVRHLSKGELSNSNWRAIVARLCRH